MASYPLVSVIIPAYNAESYIDEALRSVLAQRYANLEVIVVDDGSTDRTADRVATYRPRVNCYHQTNSGGYPGSPRNTGIKHCSGEYICFLDADDIMLPDRVEKQADFLSTHPEVGVVFTDYRNFSLDGPADQTHFQTCTHLLNKLAGKQALSLPSEEATACLVRENFGIPSTMMIRREVLSSVPEFSTDLRIGEDFHFYYRVARYYNVGLINHVGSLRRLHESNVTGNRLRMLHYGIASRTQLRDTESSTINIRLLNDYLYRREIELAWTYGSQRDLRKALVHNLRALFGPRPISIRDLGLGVRTLFRTAAIALHLKSI